MNDKSKKRLKKLREQITDNIPKCKKCGIKIFHDSPDEMDYYFDKDIICKQCWCELFGKEIEQHPIMNPKKLW